MCPVTALCIALQQGADKQRHYGECAKKSGKHSANGQYGQIPFGRSRKLAIQLDAPANCEQGKKQQSFWKIYEEKKMEQCNKVNE